VVGWGGVDRACARVLTRACARCECLGTCATNGVCDWEHVPGRMWLLGHVKLRDWRPWLAIPVYMG
jgi:hypothetical protein